jgi:hypothetical protein
VVNNFNTDVFIWTEAYNCGEILNPMINSYVKHNKYPINIFGTEKDLAYIETKSPLLKYQNLKSTKTLIKIENQILQKYKHGHKGTAELWAHIITYRPERYFLHLDSDTIFLSDVITDLIGAVKLKGYSLAGSRRPYLHRTYRKTGQDGKKLNQLPDVVNTDCFIFDKNLINTWPHFYLKRKIVGRRPIKHPVVDFFDPVSFEIISKGGLVLFRDYCANDAAQLRFKNDRRLDEMLFARQDGTLAYYFQDAEIRSMFEASGFETISTSIINSKTTNIKKGIDVDRLFLQAKFRLL